MGLKKTAEKHDEQINIIGKNVMMLHQDIQSVAKAVAELRAIVSNLPNLQEALDALEAKAKEKENEAPKMEGLE